MYPFVVFNGLIINHSACGWTSLQFLARPFLDTHGSFTVMREIKFLTKFSAKIQKTWHQRTTAAVSFVVLLRFLFFFLFISRKLWFNDAWILHPKRGVLNASEVIHHLKTCKLRPTKNKKPKLLSHLLKFNKKTGIIIYFHKY